MKKLLFLLFACISLSVSAQNQHDIIFDQFKRLRGEWEGYMEYTDESDDKTKYSMPAACQTFFNGKKWEYAVQYDEGGGVMTGGKGDCMVNSDGTKMNYDGVVWEVTTARVSGDSATIVMETSGKENRKKVDLRRTLQITSETFNIIEEVKYTEEGSAYITRNKHIFRRSKKL